MAQPTAIIYQPYQIIGNHATYLPSVVTPIPMPAGANAMLVQATGQNVRIKLDGTSPTTGGGFQIRAGDPPFLLPLMPQAAGQPSILALQETATATLEVQGVVQAFA